MTAQAFTLFDTPIGPCGLAWGPRGIVGIQLPQTDTQGTRARMRRRFPDAAETVPPPEMRRVVEAIVALLDGEGQDLSAIALDMDGMPPFDRRVYQAARAIPPGQVLTYGAIAAQLGEEDARAVGQALGRNPFPIVVPCHRVIAAGGRLGGFSAPGGASTKRRLLTIEGARLSDEPTLFDALER